MTETLLFDIKRYSINDGPGIRITIFFKGCPLRCAWCHNPESISAQKQKMFTAAKCIGCGECIKICPQQAASMTAGGIVTDQQRCDLCGACADVCPTRAVELSGFYQALPDLMQIIEKERHLFDQSQGGVTVSGGEPLLHPDYLIPLLDTCGERSIHRAVDTSGHVKTETLLTVAERTDLFLYDLKLIDSERHREFTGVGNERILGNLAILAANGAEIDIRIPLIKGVNSDQANISQTAEFIAALEGKKKTVSLLPYHAIATHKYKKLGGTYADQGLGEPDEQSVEDAIDCFSSFGISARVGG